MYALSTKLFINTIKTAFYQSSFITKDTPILSFSRLQAFHNIKLPVIFSFVSKRSSTVLSINTYLKAIYYLVLPFSLTLPKLLLLLHSWKAMLQTRLVLSDLRFLRYPYHYQVYWYPVPQESPVLFHLQQ